MQIGDHNVMLLAARPDVAWPVRVGVPPRAADCYQDRDAQLGLEKALAAEGTAVLVPAATAVMTGLGGVGKTQIAARHARNVWRDVSVDVVVWITATSRDEVLDGYANTAACLLVGGEGSSSEHAAASLLAWLAVTDRRWLIVFDDVQEPADLRNLWPPVEDRGQVIVTTRRRDSALARTDWHLIEVGVFTGPESVAYLAAKLPVAANTAEGVTELEGLADDLGHLPLALAQAAAFIANNRLLAPAEYRRRLADRRKALAEHLPDDGSLPDDHRYTVAATWSLSIDRADELPPVGLARPLLQIAALLAPAGIPLTLFTSQAVCDYLTERTGESIDSQTAGDALSCLHRLSLITLDTNQSPRAIRVHALVQRATRDATSTSYTEQLAWTAASALLEIWPEIERDTDLAAVLRANAMALHSTVGQYLWRPEFHIGGHAVLFKTGISLGATGRPGDAINYFENLYSDAVQYLDSYHSDALIIRHNLAHFHGQAGKPVAAANALEQLLADQLRILGPDHQDTLITRGNIARWRGQAGAPADAACAFEQLYVHQLRILGPDHLDTLISRHNIAFWRGEAGDPLGAADALGQLLADQLRVLGPDHPETLTTRQNIAYWLGEAGDLTGAIDAFDGVLNDRLRVQGPDHPETLVIRGNIARLRGEAGDPLGAADALEQLLADQLRVLGPDHPDTLITRHNVAFWRGQGGDPTDAIHAFEQLLADQLRVLGPDHRGTLATRHNIGFWHVQAGNLVAAAIALEQLLTDQLRVLGPDHPDTLNTRHNLAKLRNRNADE